MPKTNIDLTKFGFGQKNTSNYLIIFVNKKPSIFLYANDRNLFTVLTNKLIGNIIEINTKYIHVFQIKKNKIRVFSIKKFALPISLSI